MPVAFCICEKETEAECYGAVSKAGVQAGAMITLVLKAKNADRFIYFIFSSLLFDSPPVCRCISM